MKIFYVVGIFAFLLGCSKPERPEEVFAAAKNLILGAARLEFKQTMLWEEPNLKEIDTIRYESVFQLNPDSPLGFDFSYSRESFEVWFAGNTLYHVNHKGRTVMVKDREEEVVKSSMSGDFGPVYLLAQEPWRFKKDTVVDGRRLLDFVWVEMDTIIVDKKVYLENHLFINPANNLPLYASRRLYHDGRRNQLIEVFYSDFVFSAATDLLVLEAPSGYVSKLESEQVYESRLLSVGKKAPDFRLQDSDGNWVKLSDFRGSKVLLDFSMIRCGWCKITIDEFNKPTFEFAENLKPLYINPVDNQSEINKYISKVSIPFPVLLDAKEVGKQYGVNGYPTFYLIDEKGAVEEVHQGYTDEFMAKLNTSN